MTKESSIVKHHILQVINKWLLVPGNATMRGEKRYFILKVHKPWLSLADINNLFSIYQFMTDSFQFPPYYLWGTLSGISFFCDIYNRRSLLGWIVGWQKSVGQSERRWRKAEVKTEWTGSPHPQYRGNKTQGGEHTQSHTRRHQHVCTHVLIYWHRTDVNNWEKDTAICWAQTAHTCVHRHTHQIRADLV